MADTFSLNAPAPVLTQAQGGPAAANVSSASAGPMQAPQVPAGDPAADRTLQALTKMGREILAPHIKEAQQQQFLQGVQRAAAGEAVKDIVDQQPWYMNIFGPSSASQGARAYEVANRVAQFGAEMEKQMPKLREQGPEALQGAVTGLLKELETGDALADTAIMAQVVDQMAPLYKRHAKEHYAWTQYKAKDNQIKTFVSLQSAFEERAKAVARGVGTPEDLKAEFGRMMGSHAPFADESEEAYQEVMERSMMTSLQLGNFHAFAAMREAGIVDALPAEAQARIRSALPAAGNRALAQVIPELAVDMELLSNDMTQNPRNVAARVQAMNEKAARLAGVPLDVAQLMPGREVASIVGNVLNAQARQEASAADAAKKVALAGMALDNPVGGVIPGKANGAFSNSDVSQAIQARWPSATLEQRARWLTNSPKEDFSGVMAPAHAALAAEEATPGTVEAAELYRILDPVIRGSLFSREEEERINRFNSLRTPGTEKEAWQAARVALPYAETALKPEDKTALAQSIRKLAEKKNESFFLGINSLNDAGLEVVAAAIKHQMPNTAAGIPREQALESALARAHASGVLQSLGHEAIIQHPGLQQPNLYLQFAQGKNPVSKEEVDSAFDQLMAEKRKEFGADDAGYVIRLRDRNGQPRFQAYFQREGRPLYWTFTGEEIRARATENIRQEVAPTPQERPFIGYPRP